MKILQNKIFRIVVFILCLGVIIYECIGLYRDNQEYNVADTEYETLTDDYISTATGDEVPEGTTYPPLLINYSQLESINPDFVGWLYFPYFDISYPVVHENEIDQYLRTTFDGTSNKAGCLFTDVLSTETFTGYHDIVFGHNMRNGSMFGKLKKLNQTEDQENIKQNPYIYVYTENAIYQYQIFAFYITSVGSDAYKVVTNDEEYEDFLKFIYSHTAFQKPDSLDLSNHPCILTLSTCSGPAGGSRRFVVHAAKVGAWANSQ